MGLKPSFQKMREKAGRSLLTKIAIAVSLFSFVLIFANIMGVSFICKEVLSDYFDNQMREKIHSREVFVNHSLTTLSGFVGQMPVVFPEIAQKIAEEDFDYVIKTSKQTASLMENDGYVITDAEGNILYNTYPTECTEQQMAEFKEFVSWLCQKEDLIYNGYMKFLDQGICIVTAHALPDITTMQIKGTFIVVQVRVFDNDYLKSCGDMLQVSGQTVFEGTTLMGSSVFAGQETVHIEIGDKAIADTVYQHGTIVHTIEDYGEETYFSAYSPIYGYKGEVIGIYNNAVDVTVMKNIARTIGLSLLIIALSVGAVLIWLIIRFFRTNMTQYIERVTETVRSIADGDLTEEVHQPNTNDEISRLCKGVLDMQTSLTNTIQSISQTADFLHSSSEELSRSSFDLSDGATKQASSLEQISSSLEEMAGNIHQNKDNATVTEQKMAAADSAVQQIADSATDCMNDTQQIASSIRAINSLVGQTNILSLNASVEAARAGNMGKGFAVVAKEVGRLAEQTKITAYDISEKAEKSIIGTQNINALLDQVTPQLHSVSALIKEITVSSQEQSIGADQINIAIADLNKVTQESAVNANGIANNAQELSSMADKMNQIVGTFKLAV